MSGDDSNKYGRRGLDLDDRFREAESALELLAQNETPQTTALAPVEEKETSRLGKVGYGLYRFGAYVIGGAIKGVTWAARKYNNAKIPGVETKKAGFALKAAPFVVGAFFAPGVSAALAAYVLAVKGVDAVRGDPNKKVKALQAGAKIAGYLEGPKDK